MNIMAITAQLATFTWLFFVAWTLKDMIDERPLAIAGLFIPTWYYVIFWLAWFIVKIIITLFS